MRRVWLLSMLLAGCDLVYGLEGRLPPEARPGDEDGDGTLDDKDGCPHIADQSSVDEDDDGIPVDCDPDDTDGSTMFRWFPIKDGSVDGLEMGDGAGAVTLDGYELGDHQVHSSLIFDVDTGTAIVDVGFAIISNSVEDDMAQPWAEMGVMTVHRNFTEDSQERGDVCFLGIEQDTETDPPVVGDIYLEMNEDEERQRIVKFPPPLDGSAGMMHMLRTPSEVTCRVARVGEAPMTSSFDVAALETTTGAIAITTERLVTKLTYVWIAWQP